MANLNKKNYDTDEDYPIMEGNRTFMAKNLTKELYRKLRDEHTSSGFTIDNCIQNGVDNPDFTLGILAGDEETYTKFAELLDPCISDYHNGFSKDQNHVTDLDVSKIKDDVLDENFVISSRIRTGRNLRGFCLSPWICRSERRKVEKLVSSALGSLTGDLKGKYYALPSLSEADQKQLIDDHFLFEKPISRHFTSGGMARDFPDGRGIWHNEQKNFLVWVGEEDHTRIISMEKGGDMKKVFTRWADGLKKVEDYIKQNGSEFMWNEHLGFILTCPSNLGTGVRCSVHVKIPLLAAIDKEAKLKEICKKLRLQERGTSGELTEAVGGVYDVSNLDRLGSSEVEQVNRVIDGVKLIIEMEKRLQKGESIDDLIPQ
ncbi:arginine kinase-like [Lytechinus variegatus]|uniref:arginine kinase-like n=1 Tax=Lytechinus variegatus TaxID=7654 RepID=UPI001BB0D869|nr:arginine kinase-like [Lytechinus variegatus]